MITLDTKVAQMQDNMGFLLAGTVCNHTLQNIATEYEHYKVGQSSEKPKQSQNSLVNLGGIYLCPYGPELRTDHIVQSEES